MRRLNRSLLVAGSFAVLASPGAWAFDAAAPSWPLSDMGPIKVQYAEPGYGGPEYGGPGYGGPGYGGPGYGAPGYGEDMGGPPDQGPGDRGRFGQPPEAGRAAAHFVTYHGFKIDVGQAEGRVDVPSALAALDHQIDIVDRSGLSPSLMQTFRSVPIRISVTFTGTGGHYNGGSDVVMGSLAANDDRPVLLHEYMHVMHYKRFPGGFHNPTIRRFYEEARSRNLYPAGSYMLSNPGEFFAMTASCFLNGTVARPPYDRATIRTQQPDYYAYLGHLFGHTGVATTEVGTTAVVALHR